MLAGGDVELPSMPGAGDDIAAECAFTERSAGMWADTVKDVKLAGDVVDGKDAAISDDFTPGSGGDFGGIDEC